MKDKDASIRMKYVWELIKKDNISKSMAFKQAYKKYPKSASAEKAPAMKKEMKKDKVKMVKEEQTGIKKIVIKDPKSVTLKR